VIRLGALAVVWCALVSASAPTPVANDLILSDELPPRLSDFHFFSGDRPNARVMAYRLTTPLFSDYADKDRYIFVPDGKKADFDGNGKVVFPVGSAIIKTFRYGATKIETRVLLHRSSGWIALPYVWVGGDAVLKRAGARIDMTVRGQAVSYAVPNVNQCKECHVSEGALMPIGPKAANIAAVQIAGLRKAGLIAGLAKFVPMPRWDDMSAPVEGRARAYLDVNCGHCHNPKGAASNSGLFLGWTETDRTALGIGKRPVAAGRGSGGYDFAIDPGHPERSILVHRMKSTEPGIAMPEVGRAMRHDEGVALVSAWIKAMPAP
jgi:uncharacterized repeat protein (TIGR03806 family)